ncbi:MAG: hypothetical protein EA339_04310 [Rhodobacteraceae bacterium]|nr:MAG: hypothetical protein EA339_04310 [Paracoccaceae bacterium]
MKFLKSVALSVTAGLFAAALSAPLAAAEALSSPVGSPVLEIGGAITNTNDGPLARFDMDMLDALPQRETVTATPWHEGVQTFTGPQIADLLELVGAEGGTLRVVAINDYAVEIPVADLYDNPVILASRQNDAPMSVRDKGPLFVIYPFDENPDLFNELYFSRSVWQVKAIEVHP